MNGARILAAAAVALAVASAPIGADTWRGLVVAPEHRCAPYDRGDYRYPQSVERRIVAGLGGRVYGPYTGRCFGSTRETDIEHLVSLSETHDSGLCAADAATRRAFARDLANLTLAAPSVNRHAKGGRDAGEWLPARNRCWFTARVVDVKRKYRLSVDPREAAALDAVLAGCASTAMESPATCSMAAPASSPAAGTGIPWDDDGNGRVTCAEARRHGIAPVRRGHPAYPYMRDGDGDDLGSVTVGRTEITDGRFPVLIRAADYSHGNGSGIDLSGAGQFGGDEQRGVAGYVSGVGESLDGYTYDSRSVFYGERHD